MSQKAYRAPDEVVPIMKLHVELASRADDGVVAAQCHLKHVVPGEFPAATLAEHHMHHGDMLQLHSTPSLSDPCLKGLQLKLNMLLWRAPSSGSYRHDMTQSNSNES